jgi:hypothetical protein
MTKVQVRYELERPLDEHLLTCISAAHGIYGMARVAPTPDLRGLVVDYDASRLTIREVEAALRRAGIPLSVRA